MVKVVAAGVSIIVGLADDRQMTFQSGFEGDESDEVVNARFDRLMRFADRQKARYEIVKIRSDLDLHRRTLSQMNEDLARIEPEHRRAQAQRQVELDERLKLKDEERRRQEAEMDAQMLQVKQTRSIEYEAGVAEHQRSGRMGSFVPKGHLKANLDRIDGHLKTLVEAKEKTLAAWEADYDARTATMQGEIVKGDNERDVALGNLNAAIKRHEEEIGLLEAKEATCLKAMEG